MIVDEKSFVRKYSLIYTFIISLILLAPLSIYIKHKIDVQEITTEVKLKSIQARILRAMEAFGNNPDKVFEFPHFPSYNSGLYAKNFSRIYTQIEEPLPAFSPGYYAEGKYRFLITALPPGKYFKADYLITEVPISYSSIFLEASFIAFGIFTLILLLSIYFLQSFSLPFKRVNEKLDHFIKESVHEINTPLSIINVNVDLFDSLHGQNKYLNRIKSATKSLATIYNDMDYLIKQSRVDYPKEMIDLNVFVQERINYFELIGQLKDISLIFVNNVQVTLYFNPVKLQRIIDNTLSNAIKFSYAHGKIEIDIKRDGKGKVLLCFRDYGQGIQNPERILDGYYRENTLKNGFGIGMRIVKSIIDEEGVKLMITSEPGKGSTFSYTFTPHRIG